ncbi:hypothetical protein PTTG_00956 [Puccinia triticina 1-1 BBBD Race 1]|uniref:Uncharacterized protein n=1 Tax=Puccinia triticina (isolate 1-1 / race 1 (BBBD)) TaxID=630390 RepID=A0A180GUQ8_PUCT1|nr:hypothetical protein PTTG_00956 [Puccinia triticina 1-1 BBBD Race 1]
MQSTSHPEHDGAQREEMLKALASRTLAQFEIDGLSSDDDDDDEDYEEWAGIPSEHESDAEEEEGFSVAATDEDFDGPEDLLQQSDSPALPEPQQEPAVVVFADPSRARSKPGRELGHLERTSFMASTLRKQVRTAAPGAAEGKGKRRREDDEEAKLAHLDRSLSTLVAHLSSGPQKKKTQPADLDQLLCPTALPPPSKGLQQRHPRPISRGLARAALDRSLAADRQAIASGTVRAATAKTVSKRHQRSLDGSAARDRRARAGHTDCVPLGKPGPGGLIKLSQHEIRSATNPRPHHPRGNNRSKPRR